MSTNSYLRGRKAIPEMNEVSICLRIYVVQYRMSSVFVSYATENFDNELVLSMNFLLSVKDLIYSFAIFVASRCRASLKAPEHGLIWKGESSEIEFCALISVKVAIIIFLSFFSLSKNVMRKLSNLNILKN